MNENAESRNNVSYYLRSRGNVLNNMTNVNNIIEGRLRDHRVVRNQRIIRNQRITTNTNVVIPLNNVNNTQRKCSFCRKSGHNVIGCNNLVLSFFIKLCVFKKAILEQERNFDVRTSFLNWLYGYAIKNGSIIIKVTVVQKCGLNMTDYGATCINQLTNYIFNLSEEDIMNNQHIVENYSRSDYDEAATDTIISIHIFNIISDWTYPLLEVKQQVTIMLELEDCYEEKECVICYDRKNSEEFIKLNCQHEFCESCMKTIIKKDYFNERSSCSLCRASVSTITCKSEKIKNDFIEIS
jgi:hypothetical protein